MAKYAVTFTSSITVYVEADNRNEAIDLADEMVCWEDCPPIPEIDVEEV